MRTSKLMPFLDTFVELETGMDPTRFRWRLMKATSGEVLARRGARRE